MKNNIENKIKQEFQNREIKPSSNSWEVLNAQLEVTTTKKENKKLKFLAYAAVFIGLLFGLITFINGNKTTIDKPIIVDVNEEDKVETPDIKNELINKSEISTKNEIVTKQEFVKVKNIRKQKIIIKQHTIIAKISKEESVVLNNEKLVFNKNNKELIVSNNANDLIINNQKQLQTDNQISENQRNLRETNTYNIKKKLFSSDADIDLLLATALKSNTNKTIQEIKIHTAYLQYSVESEINTPIGNKILKTLKAGVDTVEEYITSNN